MLRRRWKQECVSHLVPLEDRSGALCRGRPLACTCHVDLVSRKLPLGLLAESVGGTQRRCPVHVDERIVSIRPVEPRQIREHLVEAIPDVDVGIGIVVLQKRLDSLVLSRDATWIVNHRVTVAVQSKNVPVCHATPASRGRADRPSMNGWL